MARLCIELHELAVTCMLTGKRLALSLVQISHSAGELFKSSAPKDRPSGACPVAAHTDPDVIDNGWKKVRADRADSPGARRRARSKSPGQVGMGVGILSLQDEKEAPFHTL